MTSKINTILSELDNRLKEIQKIFYKLSTDTALNGILNESPCWAIIGGALRDTLLFGDITSDLKKLANNWIDLDICISVDISKLYSFKKYCNRKEIPLKKNTFGGTKIISDDLGNIDFWTWVGPGVSRCSLQDWHYRLDLVDFGINGIAFVYPQKQIIVKERLIEDLNNRVIEKLSFKSPKPHLQPVRAIAIMCRLQTELGEKFNLGESIQKDLEYLVREATEDEVNESLDYLKQKIFVKRWPISTWKELAIVNQRYKCSERYLKKFNEINYELNRINVSSNIRAQGTSYK